MHQTLYQLEDYQNQTILELGILGITTKGTIKLVVLQLKCSFRCNTANIIGFLNQTPERTHTRETVHVRLARSVYISANGPKIFSYVFG